MNKPSTITVPNLVTYLPFSMIDGVVVSAILGTVATISSSHSAVEGCEGGIAAFAGAYALSSGIDLVQKSRTRRINFQEAYGYGVKNLPSMPLEERIKEARTLAEKLNDEFATADLPDGYLGSLVEEELSRYIEQRTGQKVKNSFLFRTSGVMRSLFPFAKGAADPISGEIALFEEMGVFRPHVIAHEFAHRKGYLKELEAQVLSYLALSESNSSYLRQSVNCERLSSQFSVIAEDIGRTRTEVVEESGLRPELQQDFVERKKSGGLYERAISAVMLPLYNLRMKATGQNGLSDYDRGFTNFLYAIGNRGE